MKYRYVALLFVACTFATLSPLRTYAQNLPHIVISEIQWGGSALSTADEWIELANISSETIDISGWTLTGVSSGVITLPAETLLAEHTTYLIANYDAGDVKSVLAVHPDLVTASVSVPNSDIAIRLVNSAGEEVDSYVDAGAPDVGSSSPHVSAERNLSDGTWFAASEALGVTTPETLGTPGTILLPIVEEIPGDVAVPLDEAIEIEPITDPSPESVEASSPVNEEASEPELEQALELDLSPPEEGVVIELALSEPVEPEVATEIITLIAPLVPEIVTEAVVPIAIEETEPEEPPMQESSSDETSLAPPVVTTVTLDYSPLRVTEFLSSPLEGGEWVELWNSGDSKLLLDGLTLTDASGKTTSLSGTIHANSYVLVENPAGKLNNTQDTITLTLPDGQILMTLVYGTDAFPAPKKGASAGVCDDGWRTDLVPSPAQENPCPTTILEPSSYDQSTTSTDVDGSRAASGDPSATQGDLPREERADSQSTSFTSVATSVITDALPSYVDGSSFVSNSSQTQTRSSVAKKAPSKNTVLSVTLDELDALPSGQHVQVTAVLAVAPGIFGKRVAYLNGVQLYFHAAEWPELAPGTLVQVTGVWDVDTDSRRIKISDAADIVVLGTQALVPIPLHDISASNSGDLLATASGTLLRKEGDVFIFSARDGNEFRVEDVAKTGALGALRAGDAATIVGMLLARDGVWILAPRTDHDAVIINETTFTSHSEATSGSLVSHDTHVSSSPSAPLVGGGILASSVSALGYWFIRSRKIPFLLSS